MLCVLCIYKMKNSISGIIKKKSKPENKRKNIFIYFVRLKLDFAFSILHSPALLLLLPLHFVQLQKYIYFIQKYKNQFILNTKQEFGNFFALGSKGIFTYLCTYFMFFNSKEWENEGWVVVMVEFPFYYFWGYFFYIIFFAHFTNTCRHHFHFYYFSFSMDKKKEDEKYAKNVRLLVYFSSHTCYLCTLIYVDFSSGWWWWWWYRNGRKVLLMYFA